MRANRGEKAGNLFLMEKKWQCNRWAAKIIVDVVFFCIFANVIPAAPEGCGRKNFFDRYIMIGFETKNVELPALDFGKVEAWLGEVAASHGKRIGNVNYLFCDDEEILRVNREFLRHDYFTDIITFDYSRRDRIGGDIFISLDTVRSNAEDLGVAYDNELLRVIAHGVLHLCGIDDKGPGEREIMEANEDAALALWTELKEEGE